MRDLIGTRSRVALSWVVTVGTLFFVTICLRMIVLYDRQSDYDFHVQFSREWFGLIGAGYSLIFPALQVARGLVGDVFSDLDILAVFVIVAIVVRHLLTIRLVRLLGGSGLFAHVLSSALTLFMPLYDPRLATTEGLAGFQRLYLGQLSPNVWHNSTTLVLLPAAAWSVIRGYHFFRTQTWRNAVLFSLATALAAVMKPSFLLASFPAFAVVTMMVLICDKKQRTRTLKLSSSFAVIASSLSTLVLMYLAFRSQGPHSEIEFVVSPLRQWNHHSENLLWSTGLSLLPLVVVWATIAIRKEPISLFEIWVAATFAGALCFYVLMAEMNPDGTFRLAANGYWGIVPALHLLLVVALTKFHITTHGATPSKALLAMRIAVSSLVVLHVASGAMYILLIAREKINPF